MDMKIRRVLASTALALTVLACGCERTGPAPVPGPEAPAAEASYQVGDRLAPAAATPGKTELLEIGWADLIPAGWITDELLDSLNVEGLDDNDPRAQAALQKIREEWDRAPVVEGLSGQRVRIPGFVVPVEGDGKTVREFLLVPYFGACVHVPPPPSNQVIHVLPDQPVPGEWDMAPVWVEGVLTVTPFTSSLGKAGYQLRGIKVEEYQEPSSE
ncbi:MAG TPA: DUF3299 domain-containing protein [Desulfuromonadales bacterium]